VTKERLTAFTDGVIAVIITIMVLELKTPHDVTFESLREVAPKFAGYVLSFVYVAIYWNNHHHFFHLVERVNGAVLWANLHLLFWMSLIPFTTDWLGEHPGAAVPTAIYGAALLLTATAWFIMQCAIIRCQGPGSPLAAVIGRDLKGKIAPVLYLAGFALAFMRPWLADAVYAAVALMWLVPDRRIEAAIREP
jgi:uncharacterized membrane protein